MNISGFYTQQLTLSFSSSSIVISAGPPQQLRASAPGATTTANPPAAQADTVTLSPEATERAATSVVASETKVPLPPVPAPSGDAVPGESAPLPDAPRAGGALFDVLDADGDGAITGEEFVEGARSLLRGAHQGRHHHDGRVDQSDHGRHRQAHAFGLSHRLANVFDHVESNGDGSIEADELTSALEGRRGGEPAADVTKSRAEAPPASHGSLFSALDGDGDGAITGEEFVDGARSLLRGARHHHDDNVDRSDAGLHRQAHAFGLSHRLERVFDRVDANGDGSVDTNELTAALQGRRQTEPAEVETKSTDEMVAAKPIAAPVSVTQYTSVTIAIQQYTTVSFGDAAPQQGVIDAIA